MAWPLPPAWLFAARGLQGAFAALLAPAALSLITVTFVAPKERARAFGVFGAISGGGAAIGLVVGGVLTEYASWRWCLGVNTPIALITAAFAVYEVHESKAAGDTRYDIPGAVLSTLGLVSLVYGFTEAAKPKHPSNPNDTAVRGWAGAIHDYLPDRRRDPAGGVRPLGATDNEPVATPADRARSQPRRLLPDVPARRCRAVRDVPVPDLLLPDQPRIQPGPGRTCLPAVQRRHHRRGRRSGPAAAEGRPTTLDHPWPRPVDRRHAAARPDR